MRNKRRTWTNEQLQEEALKYIHKKDFIRGSGSAYVIACRRKIINRICKHMLPLNTLATKDVYFIVSDITKEIYVGISFNPSKRYIEHNFRGTNAVKELLSKPHRLIIVDKHVNLTLAIQRENYWLRFFQRKQWHLVNQRKGSSVGLHFSPVWTKDKVLKISQEYTGTITSFKLLYPGAYAHALRNKYHNELFKKTKSLNLPKVILFCGKSITISDLAIQYNMSKDVVNQRYRRGKRDFELIQPVTRKRS